MSEAIQNATFFHYVAATLLLGYFYVVIRGKKSLRPWLKTAFGIAVACLVGWLIMLCYHRNEMCHSLQEMLIVANYNKEIDSKLANGTSPIDIVNELKQRKTEIEEKVNEAPLCDRVIGRSETIDSLLVRIKGEIDKQIYRVENMSLRSYETYMPTVFEKTQKELYLIDPVFTGSSYLNVGVVIDEEASFKKDNTLLVRIVHTDSDSLLYQQSYIPKSGANSFVLPNYFSNDMVQLQIGYVNKNEKQTYHYISCTPYGKK